MNKRTLYESIMMSVAKEVKKALNEYNINENFWNTITRSGHSAKELLDLFIKVINDYLKEQGSSNTLRSVDIEYVDKKPCILTKRARQIFGNDSDAIAKLQRFKVQDKKGNQYYAISNFDFSNDHMSDKEFNELVKNMKSPGTFSYFCMAETKDSINTKKIMQMNAENAEKKRKEENKKQDDAVRTRDSIRRADDKARNREADDAARSSKDQKKWY